MALLRALRLAALACLAFAAADAFALPGPKWAQNDTSPDMRAWILSLHAKGSDAWCCSLADGDTTTQDIRRGADGEVHWFVAIGDDWVEVPDEALVVGPNQLGRPIVWYVWTDEGPVIRCFLAGALF